MRQQMTPISAFFMDVSHSSTFPVYQDLDVHLEEVEGWIRSWTVGDVPALVKRRRGDEIILAAQGYSTAYILANLIRALWRFPSAKPYFSVACALSDVALSEVEDIETWLHPIFKYARVGMERFKAEKPSNRVDMHFGGAQTDSFYVRMLNHWSDMHHAWVQQQTPHQHLVCSLLSVLDYQHEVANLLKRSRSTVSKLAERGNFTQLLEVHQATLTVLEHWEFTASGGGSGGSSVVVESDIRERASQTLRTIAKTGAVEQWLSAASLQGGN